MGEDEEKGMANHERAGLNSLSSLLVWVFVTADSRLLVYVGGNIVSGAHKDRNCRSTNVATVTEARRISRKKTQVPTARHAQSKGLLGY